MTKSDISVYKIDETKVKIKCDSHISQELKHWFKSRPPNYRFMPQFRSGIWDGYIYYYKNNTLPIGLLKTLEDFAKKRDYSIYISFDDSVEMDFEDLRKYIQTLELPFPIRDYQENAVYDSLTKKRITLESPTSSGKSLIIYSIVRFMVMEEKPVLLVVPKTSLVEQMFSDFIEYGWDDAWMYCSKVYGDTDKDFTKPVVISTWQSLIRIRKKEVFERFECLLIDECHGAKSTSITKISNSCTNAQYRVGLSGTLPKFKTTDWFSITGSLGEHKKVVSYDRLRQDNHIANVIIKTLILRYNHDVCAYNYEHNVPDYQSEIYYIYENPGRMKFISNLASRMEKNTIILFSKISQGKTLYNEIKKHNPNRTVLYVSGETKTSDRELTRYTMEQSDDAILVASFGTFSEGVSIKNIHNIICASSYKSKIKVLQSIGRGLRMKDGKSSCNIYDIIDDLSCEIDVEGKRKKYVSYGVKHFKERKKIYHDAGFDEPSTSVIKIK
jgi:superfamily II DNA or RNA helicase